MKKNTQFYSRKTHRYLGLILGVQFLMWPLGGLYFSWSDMDQIHGDHQKKLNPMLAADMALVSPSQVLDSIRLTKNIDSIVSLQLIQILEKPVYQVIFTAGGPHQNHAQGKQIQLADARTGVLLSPLTKEQAVALARSRYKGTALVTQVTHLTDVNNHHEYRENTLPAYAITFNDVSKTTVYVATELGTIQKFRNQEWRIFDFLWMLHTMDYESRDNFGNIILRAFSIFGLFTVLSGFVLYFYTSPFIRNIKRKLSYS